MTNQRLLICPYCGETQPEAPSCRACSGLFEPLSRQATHNAMGPWFIRDEQRPFQPGCSYETLVKLIQRGRVTAFTIVRGPTTRQFWTIAKRVPGISHLFGSCYQCDASVDPEDRSCHGCGVTFGGFLDRNFLGVPQYRPLPWEQDESADRRPSVEPGEPSDWRQQTGAAGGPRGISSFATDDELLGGESAEAGPVNDNEGKRSPESPVGSGPEPSGTDRPEDHEPSNAPTDAALGDAEPLRTATAVQPQPKSPTLESSAEPPGQMSQRTLQTVSAAELTSEQPSEISVRAMQRKLARQQRTIRNLVVASVAIGAMAIIALLMWLDSRGAAPTTSRAQPNEARSQPAPAQRELPQGASRETGAPLTLPDLENDRQQAAPRDMFTREHQEAYEEALHLMERANDASRPASERIDDLEKAVAALTAIERQVAGSELPGDFDEHLTRAREELDRLQWRKLFP